MGKVVACLAVSSLLLSCAPSPSEADSLHKWRKYKDPKDLMGLQVKPIDVRYEVGGIYINGNKMDALSALNLLKRSRELSPRPDIVVSAKGGPYGPVAPFLRSVSDADLCNESRCWIKTVR